MRIVILLLAVSSAAASVLMGATEVAVRSPRCSTVSMMSESLYCLNVQLCVKPELREEFFQCIRANQRGTLTKEPLAVTCIFGEDRDNKDTFHFFEQYEGVEGFKAHTQTPHFAAWEKFAATEPFTSPPVVSFYTEDSPGKMGLAGLPTCATQSHFCLHVALHVKPERRKEFLKSLRADQHGALTKEAACATYLFGEDANTPNVFHMFEAYTDNDGFLEHSKTAHYAAWSDFKATEPFDAPTAVSYYNTLTS